MMHSLYECIALLHNYHFGDTESLPRNSIKLKSAKFMLPLTEKV